MDDERLSLPRRVAMRAWRLHVATVRSRLVRPLDGRQAHAAGRRAVRVLLVGSGPVVGWGVGSHDLALPGAVARALAAATGRGAVVDVLPHPSAGVRRLRGLLAHAHVERYDALVISGAVADAMRLEEPKAFAKRLRELLTYARSRGSGPVVWLGAQPIRSIRPYDSPAGRIADVHARRLNALAGEVCRETGALYVGLDAPGCGRVPAAPHAGRLPRLGPAHRRRARAGAPGTGDAASDRRA
ncbi:GDSL-type esterase/lipase family protein [Leifsonia sp. L25]|uniref:GDSL-type esterase/lipase family protein n=1 Tax=Leifsonia sp. L25 TaxID=3423957 RepID=UPI003D697536